MKEKKKLVPNQKSSFEPEHDTFERISIEQYNRELDEAVQRVKNGEFYTHEEVVKMAAEW